MIDSWERLTNSTHVSAVALRNGTDTFTSFASYTSQTAVISLTWRTKILTGYGIWKMSEILNKTFSKFYSPSEHLAIDEGIVFCSKEGPFSDNTYTRNTKVCHQNFTNHVTHLWQFTLYLAGVRNFHTEMLYSSSSMIYWQRWRKSVDTKNTWKRLVCLGPWRWRNKNITCELRMVGRAKFLAKCGGRIMCVWCVCVCVRARARNKTMFLALPRQGTIPKILRLEFPTQTWGLQQKFTRK